MIANFKESAAYIQSKTTLRPETAIILGSGLGDLAEQIDKEVVIPYGEIPHFPVSTAIGHKGNLIFGTLGGKPIMAMQGRFHFSCGRPYDYRRSYQSDAQSANRSEFQ